MKKNIQKLLQHAIKSAFGIDFDLEKIKIDFPPEGMGEYSTSVALILTKEVGMSPMEVAEELKNKIPLNPPLKKGVRVDSP
jgi:arginyl-tRNA synthetase